VEALLSAATVILSAVRTPYGALLGSLSDVSGPDLGGMAGAEAIRRCTVSPEEIQRVLLGNVSAHATGGNPTAAASRKAGLPAGIQALTLRAGCASGLAAISLAAEGIATGRIHVALAGGFESSSRAPHLAGGLRRGLRLGGGNLLDAARHDGPVATPAGNEADRDAFMGAREKGWFKEEILPVEIPKPRKKQAALVDTDDAAPAAAAAPPLADGAAALVLASEEWARSHGLTPLGRIAPIESSPAESVAGMTLIEADLPEDGVRALMEKAPGSDGIVNPTGGGAILGHATGADGARLVVSLVHALRRRGGGRGLAIAGDPHGATSAVAVAVEIE
jgi:acetyl-CoA C-acetyltransferase